MPDRNWQPTLSHTPPPKWHAFFIPPLSSLPQTQIKNEIKTLRRQAGKQELTVCSTSLSNSSDWKGIWLAHYDEIAMFQPWTRNNRKCFLIRHTTLRNSTSKHKKERVKDSVSSRRESKWRSKERISGKPIPSALTRTSLFQHYAHLGNVLKTLFFFTTLLFSLASSPFRFTIFKIRYTSRG